MWMVQYTHLFGVNAEKDENLKSYIEPFDGLIMWTWEEKDVYLIPEKFEILSSRPTENALCSAAIYTTSASISRPPAKQ